MMARTTKRVVTRRVASAAGAAAAGAAAAGGVKCQAVHSTAKKPRNAPIPKTTEQANAVSSIPKSFKPSISRLFEQDACRKEGNDGFCFSDVIGCDEAGRGPLCGPVVAAAAWIHPDATIDHGIHDSKATTEAQREAAFEVLINHPSVKYAVVRIEHDEIDEINILQASLKAMRLACTSVLNQLQAVDSSFHFGNCLCLVDGNKVPSDMPVKTAAIVKGDSLAFSIAAASIIAKISRDRIMTDYDKEYPLYGIAQHKGYPTLAHRTVLARLGPSPIHRMSYRPVYESVKGYVKEEKVTLKDKKKKNVQSNKVTKSVASVKKMKTTKNETVSSKAKRTTSTLTSESVERVPSLSYVRVTRSSTRKRKELEGECTIGCEILDETGDADVNFKSRNVKSRIKKSGVPKR